ncbi:hypothetical protein ACUOA8_36415, partial [Escherichia sp. SS-MK2]
IHSRLSIIVDEYLNHNYGEYLFPHSNKVKRIDGKKGPFYSQAFSRLRRSVLPIATDRQCFHSLRGMFITCLDRAGVPEQRIGAITGHTEQRAKTESALQFDLQFEQIRLVSYATTNAIAVKTASPKSTGGQVKSQVPTNAGTASTTKDTLPTY